jgi:hypothetical protein
MSTGVCSSRQLNSDFSGDNKTAFRLNNRPAGGFLFVNKKVHKKLQIISQTSNQLL